MCLCIERKLTVVSRYVCVSFSPFTAQWIFNNWYFNRLIEQREPADVDSARKRERGKIDEIKILQSPFDFMRNIEHSCVSLIFFYTFLFRRSLLLVPEKKTTCIHTFSSLVH